MAWGGLLVEPQVLLWWPLVDLLGSHACGHHWLGDERSWLLEEWCVLPQMLTVVERYPAGAIPSDGMLVKLAHHYDHTCAFPSPVVVSHHVLCVYVVTHPKWVESMSVLAPLLKLPVMSLSEGPLPMGQCFLPRIMGAISASGIGMASLIGRPNRTWTGDHEAFVSGSGEFLYSGMAFWNPSVSKDLLGPTLSINILFAVLNAISALLLAWGFATEVMRCCTPHSTRKDLVWPALNGVPHLMSSLLSQMFP